MFLNEAALVGKLFHPHILAIYDAVSDENVSYIVMEYVNGQTLEDFCDVADLLPISKVVEIIFKCSLALAFAQRHGVIHCDIKPANILISDDTNIKISDFGAAQYDDAEHTHLKGIGSPAYMSPEQVQDKEVSYHTDIYSLGVVMYQMLTGKLPFRASSKASLLYQVVNMPAVPPSTFRREVPAELDRLVLRCLEKDPAARFPTWGDFSRELTHSYRNLEVPADTITDTEKFNTLKSIAFFRDFREQELWETLRITHVAQVSRASTRSSARATSGDSFYILTSGEAKVTKAGRLLNILRAGDCFGEMLYFSETNTRRSTTITSLSRAHRDGDQGRRPVQGLRHAAEGNEQGLPAHSDRPPDLGEQSPVCSLGHCARRQVMAVAAWACSPLLSRSLPMSLRASSHLRLAACDHVSPHGTSKSSAAMLRYAPFRLRACTEIEKA